MKGDQCYELFGGIALKNHAFLERNLENDKFLKSFSNEAKIRDRSIIITLCNTYFFGNCIIILVIIHIIIVNVIITSINFVIIISIIITK